MHTPEKPGDTPPPRGSISLHPLASTAFGPANTCADEGLIRLLESSFKLLASRPENLAEHFYRRLFASHPGLRAMFKGDMPAQQVKLTETLAFVVEGLRDPVGVRIKLRNLGQLHDGKGVRPEHYAIVRDELLASMRAVCGPEWNDTLDVEWRRAIDQIGELMQNGARPVKRPDIT